MTRFLTTTALALTLSGAAHADDVALLIGNEDYDAFSDVRRADEMTTTEDALGDLGFTTVTATDADADDIIDALHRFLEAAEGDGRVLVALGGRFVTSGQDSWLLPTDAPDTIDIARISGRAVPVSTVLAVLARHPGEAVLAIGALPDESRSAGPFLTHGLGPINAPQGVTVIRGAASAMSGFVGDTLLDPDSAPLTVAARAGLTVTGFAPTDFAFVTTSATASAITAPDDGVGAAEAAYWAATNRINNIAAYEAYLDRYPDGLHATEAESRITEIKSEPNRAARLAEEALSLTRNQRREIQRDLSLLGYDTRGIDGIFGPGTRSAARTWQRDAGLADNGYFTRDQITRLDAQAERRAAELEAEAEARRAEQEARDRAFWAETGSLGDEAGLRAYLNRFPDGVFAEVAQERLTVIETEKRAAAAAQDNAAWDRATAADTPDAYRDYLTAFPEGAFVEDANARITELTQTDEERDAIAAAEAREAALSLNPLTRRIVEERLTALGLNPGTADGTFDDDTRRAIRRYQAARDLEVTGYLTQDAIVRLLADSILR